MSSHPLLVVGSVAIDWIITPHAEREESVGGSATYFSMAASPFAPIRLVGVVGKDFPERTVQDLKSAGVDTAGLEVVDDGLTFRWKGRYHENMNDRDTLETHLNVFEDFSPKVPDSFAKTPYVFLANIQPSLQLEVLNKLATKPEFVGLDTMNLWIDIASDDLRAVLERVDMLAINEEEALQLSGKLNLVEAAREVRAMGPKTLIIKRGEYGALLFGPEDDALFSAPGLPLEMVHDPTGAGDCFAGGMMGYLAREGAHDDATMRKAVIWGSVMASYCVEEFSYDRLRGVSIDDIQARYERFISLTKF